MKKLLLAILLFAINSIPMLSQDTWNQILANPFNRAHDTLDYDIRISPASTLLDASSSYVIKEITDRQDTTRVLNWANLLAETKDKNGVFVQYAFSILNTEIYTKGLVFNVGFSHRSEAYANFDGPGVTFVIGGNAGFDAQTELAPDIEYNSWYQLNLGAKKYFNNSFLGLNLKLVDGVEHFSFDGSYKINADDIFNEIQVERNVILQSTSLFRYKNIDDIDFQPSRPFTDQIGFDNIGFLFDIYGGTKVGKHIFNLAITDIGFIKWEQEGRTFEYESKGNATYSGIDLSEALSNEFEFNLQDSIENLIGLEQTDTRSYNTSLLTKINARYQYDFQDDLSFGINNFFAIDGTYGYFRTSLFANKAITNWLDLGLVYSFDRYSAANIGGSLQIQYEKFSLGLSSQNLLSLFDPYGFRLNNINIATQIKI